MGEVLDDLTAALGAARYELVVASDTADDVLGRMARNLGLDEVRIRVAAAEDLQEQVRIVFARAVDAADMTMDRLRRDEEQLRTLTRHPERAREHLTAAETFFDEIDRLTSSEGLPGSPTGTPAEGWAQQVKQLRTSFPLIGSAVGQVTQCLQDGQERVEEALRVLAQVADDLRAGSVESGTARQAVRVEQHLTEARTQVQHAGLGSEAGSQYAYAAAVIAHEARTRQRLSQHGQGPGPASPTATRPPR